MFTEAELKVREESFLTYRDTLTKEPSGDVKKEYYVGCVDKVCIEVLIVFLEWKQLTSELILSLKVFDVIIPKQYIVLLNMSM